MITYQRLFIRRIVPRKAWPVCVLSINKIMAILNFISNDSISTSHSWPVTSMKSSTSQLLPQLDTRSKTKVSLQKLLKRPPVKESISRWHIYCRVMRPEKISLPNSSDSTRDGDGQKLDFVTFPLYIGKAQLPSEAIIDPRRRSEDSHILGVVPLYRQ